MATIGRPREFDTDQALTAAMLVFWKKGYFAATLEDLTEAMQINRPSLYAAFGDKEGLFLATVDRYVEQYSRGPRQALMKTSIEDALREFFESAVRNGTGRQTPAGCLVACVLMSAATESPALMGKFKGIVASTDLMLEERLKLAAATGELPENADVPMLARLANSLRHGLLFRARAGEARSSLLEAAHAAERLILNR